MDVGSPTSRGVTLMRHPFAHFIAEEPLSAATSLSASDYELYGTEADHVSSGRESSFFQQAMKFLPSYVKRVGAPDGGPSTMSAFRLFDSRAGRNPPYVALPWSCIPKLLLRSNAGYPAFNVDMKTLEAVAWDEIVTYVCMSMLNCMFAFRAVVPGEPEPEVLVYLLGGWRSSPGCRQSLEGASRCAVAGRVVRASGWPLAGADGAALGRQARGWRYHCRPDFPAL